MDFQKYVTLLDLVLTDMYWHDFMKMQNKSQQLIVK